MVLQKYEKFSVHGHEIENLCLYLFSNKDHITMKIIKTVAVTFISVTAALLVTFSCSDGSKWEGTEFSKYYEGLPFEMGLVSRPEIPSTEAVLTDFGGNGNGTFLNTEAFASAVDWLSERGGGHLIVPEGVWMTGPIELKSGIDLHVTSGAVILFDGDRDLYPIIETSFEGLDTWRCESPIHAEGAENVSITGGGVIDGNGHLWRAVKKSKLTSSQWKEQIASGGILNEAEDCWYPSEGFLKAERISDMNTPPKGLSMAELEEIKDFLRPVMISFRNCRNVLLEDCTFQNSPAWNIHPLMCENVIVKDVTVKNPSYAQNGDGIDVESCTNTLIVDSYFDVGDDGICVKSGKDEDGRKRAIPTKGLIVDGCTVYHGHGGFVVGSEMSGGVEDVKVSDCRFLGTDVGLRFKSKRGRGGVVKNIHISDITMTDIVTETVLFDLHYGGKSAVEALADGTPAEAEQVFTADETTPSFRDIFISGIVCNGAGRAMYFNGLPEMPVRNINISDCTINSRKGMEICWSEDITLDNVTVVPETGEPLITANVTNLSIL